MPENVSRDEFKQYFGKVGWPASVALVVEIARDKGAPTDFLNHLQMLPNRLYMSEDDLWTEYWGHMQRAAAA